MSPKSLSSMLKALRKRQGVSQAALAERVKVSDAYIAMLETGIRKNPSLVILKRLAKALGVGVAELVE